MAGDWIPMDHDLPRKVEVLAIHCRTDVSIAEIILALHGFWSHVDRHTLDGHLRDVTVTGIVTLFGRDRDFWMAVHAVGWLGIADDGHVFMPRFDRRFSTPARARMLASRRSANYRARKSSDERDASVTRALQNRDAAREATVDPEPEPEPEPEPKTEPQPSQPESGSTVLGDGKPPPPPKAPGGGGGKPASGKSKPDYVVELDALVAKWNSIPGVAPCRLVTEKRKAAYRARAKEHGWKESVDEALAKVASSIFCTGGGRKGWRADLDWFLKPGSVASAIEGKYDDAKMVPLLTEKEQRNLDVVREWADSVVGGGGDAGG